MNPSSSHANAKGSHKLPAWRATTTPELLQPRDPPRPWLTLNAARRSFQHGGLPQRIASAASNASRLQWPASTLPGPTVATSGTKFSECINNLVACIYFSNRGNKQREIQRAHTRETCAPCDSDVDVCSPSCRGNFNKTTSCTWPRTSSTCATTSS